MADTYTMTATNGDRPRITYEVSTDIHKAFQCAKVAQEYFRDVRIVSDDTGEVMYNHYLSDACPFLPTKTLPEVIQSLETLYMTFLSW